MLDVVRGEERRAWLVCAALVFGLPAGSLFAHPGSGIVVDRRGEVYFVDTGSGMWKIDTRGVLVKIQAPGFHWMALDEDDRFARTALPSGPTGEITTVGAAPTVLLSSDYPIAITPDRNLCYPARRAGGGAVDLLRVEPSARRSVLATVPLPYLNGLAAAPDGSLYFTEDAAVRRVSSRGEITTIARVAPDKCGRIPGYEPGNHSLRGLAVDSAGTVFVAASGCGSVLKITPEGRITSVLQLEGPWSPTAVALFRGDLYVLEYLHTPGEDRRQWVPRVRKISADGTNGVVATVTR